jgi:hyperosmotically inducible protein
MKPITASLMAVALSAAFASAYAQDSKPDTAAYRTTTQKAAADFKVANAACKNLQAAERSVCVEEAKVARARAEIDAVNQYNNTSKARNMARSALANAEYALAKVKCATATGAEKDSCLANAASVRTAALANAKADRDIGSATAAAVGVDNKGTIATTATTDPTKAAAVDKCAQIAGRTDTGCLIDNKERKTVATAATSTAATAGAAVDNAADRTRNAAANVAQKTENVAERAVQKTKEVASNVADKTERAADTAAAKTGKVVADTVITTKVKADLFKEPELSAMAIHVETEKGVVMLSGFVDSKADAEKAVRLAKSVEGVTSVKSAIKVK